MSTLKTNFIETPNGTSYRRNRKAELAMIKKLDAKIVQAAKTLGIEVKDRNLVAYYDELIAPRLYERYTRASKYRALTAESGNIVELIDTTRSLAACAWRALQLKREEPQYYADLIEELRAEDRADDLLSAITNVQNIISNKSGAESVIRGRMMAINCAQEA
jgi:hypothetical protein